MPTEETGLEHAQRQIEVSSSSSFGTRTFRDADSSDGSDGGLTNDSIAAKLLSEAVLTGTPQLLKFHLPELQVKPGQRKIPVLPD